MKGMKGCVAEQSNGLADECVDLADL